MGRLNDREDTVDLQRSITKCERYFALLEKHIKNMYTIESDHEVEKERTTKESTYEIEMLHKRMYAKECEVKLLQSELNDKMKCIENLNKQIKKVEYLSSRKSEELQKMCSKFDRFKNSVNSIVIDNEQLDAKIMKLQLQLSYVRLECNALAESNEDKDSFINELETMVEGLNDQKATAQSEISRLQESILLLIGIIVNASQKGEELELHTNEIESYEDDYISMDVQDIEESELQKGLNAVKEIRSLMLDNGFKKMQQVLNLVKEPRLLILKNTTRNLCKRVDDDETDDDEDYPYSLNGRRN